MTYITGDKTLLTLKNMSQHDTIVNYVTLSYFTRAVKTGSPTRLGSARSGNGLFRAGLKNPV